MQVFYSDDHRKRDAKTELSGGRLIAPHECPARMDHILRRLTENGWSAPEAPGEFGMAPIEAIHDADFIEFLRSAWDEWTADGQTGEAIANCWPARRMGLRRPEHIEGKLGYYALAAETSISEGTWEAAYASAQVALSGAAVLAADGQAAFSLCRPPGHHATRDMFGGYCFLNNAAIAAQSLRDAGANRVAILDVDFHHGNGTQDIFYERGDVLFISIHGEPEQAYPHFLGYADETGLGDGAGFNRNYPLPPGTPFGPWRACLTDALDAMAAFKPDAQIISLGVDTFKNDPISFFRLESEDFVTMGKDIAQAQRPTLFVMEGGYAIEEIGVNTVNVLEGFRSAS